MKASFLALGARKEAFMYSGAPAQPVKPDLTEAVTEPAISPSRMQ